jgi:hypothetical protein
MANRISHESISVLNQTSRKMRSGGAVVNPNARASPRGGVSEERRHLFSAFDSRLCSDTRFAIRGGWPI